MCDFCPAEQAEGMLAELEILRSGSAADVSLCRYGNVSCVRCCLPHIGGDSHLEDSGEKRIEPFNRSNPAGHPGSSDRYFGPRRIVMKFKNFNPLQDPRIVASQYEDSFPDVGREEMEKRFSARRELFLGLYDREQPGKSLLRYMESVQKNEGYKYRPAASSGPASVFLGGSIPAGRLRKGELPECQLLGFVDGKRTAGCLAHPLAETSQRYDGRDRAGFFKNTGDCGSVGCEASREFRFLSTSAMKVFNKAVDGMSWYEYSRHATSVLVYYLRSYDYLLQKLDERELLETMTLEQVVGFTNRLYDAWPIKNAGRSARHRMNSLEVLSTDIPLAERIMHIALGTWFLRDHFALQLQQARDHVERHIEALIFAANGTHSTERPGSTARNNLDT